MNKILLCLTILILASSCYRDPYLLKDEGKNKYYLSDIIGDMENRGFLKSRPLIIIDTIKYRPRIELKTHTLPLFRDNIERLKVISIAHEKQLEAFGNDAKDGIIIIYTKQQRVP